MKTKVYLCKMFTPIGRIPVLCYGQKVNRDLRIYAAYRQINNYNESIFFIIRKKDVARLQECGYTVIDMVLKAGCMPRLIRIGDTLMLEQSKF